MAKIRSFTKYENKVVPRLRQNLNMAESTEDVKKFFVYAVKEFMEDAVEGKMDIRYEDISLNPEREPHYSISERLSDNPEFDALRKDSDLGQVLARMAESAMKRYKYLQRNPDKTEVKIRM